MTKTRSRRSMWIALALVGALGGSGGAWAAALPPVQAQGTVTFLTGGIGVDEARALQAQAAKWPVMLEFAAKERHGTHDAFLADVEVQILDAKKSVVLDTRSGGPFVLARLQPGHYEVKASFDGRTMTRDLHVTGKGTAREVFVWPDGAQRDAS